MAFSSSVPAYNLDHHTNWHHQLQQQQPNNHHQQQQQLLQNPHLPPQPPQVDQGSIRPGSMVDRARIAKLPLPEAGLNCPRCDSTQTKFCYFNNYSLTQPRHFCKTCRRYWTRGGALRSVPVGGGCRRNKRTKSRTSKSPNITNNQKGSSSSNNISSESPSRSADQMVANHNNPFSSQVPLMAALQNLNSQYGTAAGSAYGGFQMGNGSSGPSDMGFQLGHKNTSNLTNNILTSGGAQGTWRLPILTGFEQQSGSNLFSYQGEGIEAASAAPVKVEETRGGGGRGGGGGGGLNLSRQFLGVSDQNNTNTNNSNGNQYWGSGGGGGGNSWTTDFTCHINNTSSASTPFL